MNRPRTTATALKLMTVSNALLAVPVSYLGVLTARAMTLPPHDNNVERPRTTRFVVLVPAHNEATTIGALMTSLRSLDYPPCLVRVHVVADNCTDETAEEVRRHGFDVHERFDREHPGKGPALNWLLSSLVASGEAFDVAVFLDADSVVDPGLLSAFEGRVLSGEQVVQGHYSVKDADSSPAAALRYAALACRHHLRPLARTSFGGSSGLFGNGMAFTRRLVVEQDWSAHLVEDLQLQMKLLVKDVLVAYEPLARIEAEMPNTLRGSETQHQRWEQGRLQIAREFVPRLCGQIARRGTRHRVAKVDATLDLVVPPLSLLVGGVSIAGVGSALMWRQGGRTARRNPCRLGLFDSCPRDTCPRCTAPCFSAQEHVPVTLPRSYVRFVEGGTRAANGRTARSGWLGADTAEHAMRGHMNNKGGAIMRNSLEPIPVAVVMGVPVEDVTMRETLDLVEDFVRTGREQGRTFQIATVNVDFIVNARRDQSVMSLLHRADICIPDGVPVLWSARLQRTPLRERVAGADLVMALVERSVASRQSVLFFGSSEGIAEAAARRMREQYPGAQVRGLSGTFMERVEHMSPQVLDELIGMSPDIICVALGNPKQERWINAYRDRLGIPVLIGVGGTLDFLVGERRRAPIFVQRWGLEWIYRALQEPRRLAPRYARDAVAFMPHLFRCPRRAVHKRR